jgi:hypothetical protein
LDQR